jgi:hypothetical protein
MPSPSDRRTRLIPFSSFARHSDGAHTGAPANNSVCFVVIASGILYSGQRSGPMRAEAQGLGGG